MALFKGKLTVNAILIIWTLVGFASSGLMTQREYDWRPLVGFKTIGYCQRAAAPAKAPAARHVTGQSAQQLLSLSA